MLKFEEIHCTIGPRNDGVLSNEQLGDIQQLLQSYRTSQAQMEAEASRRLSPGDSLEGAFHNRQCGYSYQLNPNPNPSANLHPNSYCGFIVMASRFIGYNKQFTLMYNQQVAEAVFVVSRSLNYGPTKHHQPKSNNSSFSGKSNRKARRNMEATYKVGLLFIEWTCSQQKSRKYMMKISLTDLLFFECLCAYILT